MYIPGFQIKNYEQINLKYLRWVFLLIFYTWILPFHYYIFRMIYTNFMNESSGIMLIPCRDKGIRSWIFAAQN